jgi:hypothetical protein
LEEVGCNHYEYGSMELAVAHIEVEDHHVVIAFA